MPDTVTATAPPTAPPADKPAALDDLMIAMDVVDTIRHREDLVARELNDSGREAELVERLREIYRQQGIEVPDRVLQDGVKALKDSRFVYKPAPASWKRTLFELWVTRARWGKVAALALAVGLGGWALYHVNIALPARQAEEKARIELTETLPKAIRQGHADILAVATDPLAKQRADALLADGERAMRDRDRKGMTRVAADMAGVREEIAREYTLTIVSRPGETTGVWRRPPRSNTARNYYLIVEAVTPDGRKLKLPVRNEETGATDTVDKFGVRVPQSIWETVAADKRDDGIVQKSRFGVKKRGTTVIDYLMPFEGGYITKW